MFGKVARIFALVVFLAALSAGSFAQQFNVYEDQLENGWQNWSWCTTDFANTQYVYAGKSSVKVTFTAGNQGFYLESSLPFEGSFFSSLSFYINGGTIAKRSMQIQAIVNGNPLPALNLNKYIAGGSVAAKTWRKVTVPLTALKVVAGQNVQGFWLQDTTGAAQPAFWVDEITWVPTMAVPLANLTVNPTEALRTVDARTFGVNTAVWDNNLDSSGCRTALVAAGFQAFRFPGGSLSDGYHWQTDTTDSNTWTWATNFDAFAAVAMGQGAQAMITTNYGTGTPTEAAAWVAYSNVTKGYGFKNWEIGNEVYGTWEEDSHPRPNDPYTYAVQYAAYYQAMKAQDPTIRIGAVASPGEDAYVNYTDHPATNPRTGQAHNGWTPVMLATLKSLGVTPDFVIYHRYPENQGQESDFLLLQINGSFVTDIADLRQQLSDYLGSNGAPVKIICTENNSQPGTEGKQMVSIVNGLFLADSVGTSLQTECEGYFWWDLINGQTTAGNNGSWLYGWREYGDEGLVTPDTFEPYPTYYIEKLLSKFASPGDTVIPVKGATGLLSVYGVKHADGSVRLLAINKSPTTTLAARIAFTGFVAAKKVQEYSYGIPQDNAAKTGKGSQDLASTIANIGARTTTVSIGPYSATVYVFAAALGGR